MKITANHVTITRIALLPLPAWLLLSGNQTFVWIGLTIAIALGATDALDGYMARRDGPTVLGGLLDPAADKIFVAAFLIPIVALGHCPWWVAALIFVRELLITSLRSSVAARDETLTTSRLGKIKTIAQMGGLGLYVFVMQLPQPTIFIVHAIGVGTLTLLTVIWLVRGKKPPFWFIASLILWCGVVALQLIFKEPEDAVLWMFIIMAGLTWFSGIDYFIGSARIILGKGVKLFDVVRAFWSVAQGIAPAALTAAHPKAAIPVLVGLACALGVGGIDNIASASGKEPIRAFLLATGVLATATALLGPGLEMMGRPYPVLWAIIAGFVMLFANLISLTRAFVQHRDVFKETS